MWSLQTGFTVLDHTCFDVEGLQINRIIYHWPDDFCLKLHANYEVYYLYYLLQS